MSTPTICYHTPLGTEEDLELIQRDTDLAKCQQSQSPSDDSPDDSTTFLMPMHPIAMFEQLSDGSWSTPQLIVMPPDTHLPEGWFQIFLGGGGWISEDLAASLREANRCETSAKARHANNQLACQAMLEAKVLGDINRRFLELVEVRRASDLSLPTDVADTATSASNRQPAAATPRS